MNLLISAAMYYSHCQRMNEKLVELIPGKVYSCRHCRDPGRPAIGKLHLRYHLLQTANITHWFADIRKCQNHQHTSLHRMKL